MPKEINILLLGETGAGKSTTLNALANYLNFNTFDEAVRSVDNFTEVVPSQFTLPDNENPGKERIIKSGFSDINERHGSGNSVTLAPTGYNFTYGDNVLRIIDTPGIGDTGGSEADNKNFDQILLYLQKHKNLHGIIIIVKGNDNRKTLFFKYCITELLTHLHRSVIDNIVFCFTNSQITPGVIGQGEGYKVMESFLKDDISQVGIRLEPGRNAFFIENDAYRFLVAKKHGYQYNEIQELLQKLNWNHSVAEIQRMLNHISELSPHQLDATVSLNKARKIVIKLSEPIVILSQKIEKNLEEIKEAQRELENGANLRESLAAFREKTITDLVKKLNQEPQMVCTAECCIERVYVEGEGEKINFKTVCHKPCLCLDANEIFGTIANKFCDAMDTNVLKSLLFRDIKCRKCGCMWTTHKPVSYTYEKVNKKIVNSEVERKLERTSNDIEAKEVLIQMSQKSLNEMKKEKEKIEEIGSKFAYFLSTNSTFTHNRYFESYIEMMIEDENRKSRPNTDPLRKLKLDHEASVKRLQKAIENKSSKPVTAEDIPQLLEELLALKHNGPQFRQILQANEELEAKFKSNEKKFNFQKVTEMFSKILKF